ncbi:MAG: protease complex subunit PrcB family protein [Planctomycetota bacterium]
MTKRALTIGGTLALSALAFATGCKSTTPAHTNEPAASAPAETVTVDVSNVTSLDIQGSAAAEMGGPENYTLTLITSADDLPAAVSEQGLEVDFEVHDVVLLGMGEQPSSGYGADITGIQQVGATIYVQANFTHPAPDNAVAEVITSPWAAAVIAKCEPGVMLLSDFD